MAWIKRLTRVLFRKRGKKVRVPVFPRLLLLLLLLLIYAEASE